MEPTGNQTLKEWRSEHRMAVLEANRVMLIEIRDGTVVEECSHCGKDVTVPIDAKLRLEASRQLAQMVSILVPEKVTAGDGKTLKQISVDEISDKDKKEIDDLIKGDQAWE